jgi:HPt (histidine-containing phosphotransfer) domain-containing protein
MQATSLAEAIMQGTTRVHFTLPDQVNFRPNTDPKDRIEMIPSGHREQNAGGLRTRWLQLDTCNAIAHRLSELERSADIAISIAAGLLRYAIAYQIIYRMLPAGKSVTYAISDGEDIPNQPVHEDALHLRKSAVQISVQAQETFAAEAVDTIAAPYVDAANHFFLPQWVAFDEQGQLLLNSLQEAQAHIASLQKYLLLLEQAVQIAPFMNADETWQQKHYGILGQLVNQGRALAVYQTHEIIKNIQRRAADHRLDRGFSLRLPYFDDKKNSIENYEFTVIPSGWIMFIPAFAVLAAREQQIKVAQDDCLSITTRKHLLAELHSLELSFLR